MEIRDKILEPFFITADERCLTVKETVTVQDENSDNYGEEYDTARGYYADLLSALKKINHLQGKQDGSVKEYIDRLENILSKFNNKKIYDFK